MDIGPYKPLLTLLVLPPASPLIVALFGLVIMPGARRLGFLLTFLGIASLWLLSCGAFAVWLAQMLLPNYPPQNAATLKKAGAQAIVVLGGGITSHMPEFGSPQPNGYTSARLRYGVWLARQSGLPMAYSGGVGWGADKGDERPPPEGEVVQRVLMQEYNQPLRWVESRARDTQENAELLAPLLLKDGMRHIALVTSYPHMPRAVLEFRRAGFDVVPAPTGYYRPWNGNWLAWLPTAGGLEASWYVLRERLGLDVAKWRGPGKAESAAAPSPNAKPAAAPAR